MSTWTLEVPKEPGTYWCYGYIHSTILSKRLGAPEIRFVRVHQGANSLVYVCDGHFCYPHRSELPTIWMPAELPHPPTYMPWQFLWSILGDVPVDDDGMIQEPFQEFPVGTDRETIWHWFEETYNISLGKEVWK